MKTGCLFTLRAPEIAICMSVSLQASDIAIGVSVSLQAPDIQIAKSCLTTEAPRCILDGKSKFMNPGVTMRGRSFTNYSFFFAFSNNNLKAFVL